MTRRPDALCSPPTIRRQCKGNAMNLQGKRVLITGGSSGIGFAIARILVPKAQGGHFRPPVRCFGRGQRRPREIEALATSTDLSIRQIQSKIAGRASRGIVGEITKRARAGQPTVPRQHFTRIFKLPDLRTISLSRRCQDADAGLCRKRHQVPDLFRVGGANSGKGAPASIFMPARADEPVETAGSRSLRSSVQVRPRFRRRCGTVRGAK